MTRLVGNGQTTPGSIELVYRLDLHDIDLEQRPAAVDQLVDDLHPGATIEIIQADLTSAGKTAVIEHLAELAAGGVTVKLVGPPAQLTTWLLPTTDG